MTPHPRRLPFTTRQLTAMIGIGWAFWFAGALLCRVIGDLGWFNGTARLLVYVAIIPGTIPVVLLLRRVAQPAADHVGLAVAIATAAAIMLDGIALAWFPALYGPGIAQTAASGAVILWGGFVALTLGCWFNRVPQ